jgi:MFS family permease
MHCPSRVDGLIMPRRGNEGCLGMESRRYAGQRGGDLLSIFRRKPGYRWVMFGLSFSNMMAEGGITDIVPVIYLAVRNYFHWSATATAGIFSVAGLTGMITAPIAGRLLDRLDPRYVFVLGGLLIAIGFVTSSWASELWQLMLLYGVVLTIGETIVSGFAISALLAPWFPRVGTRLRTGRGGQSGGDAPVRAAGPAAGVHHRLAGYLPRVRAGFPGAVGARQFFLPQTPTS